MLTVSPPTEMRRSFALPVVTAPVRMGLTVPVAVPEPSAIPDKSAHSETSEARAPGEGVPIKSIVSVAGGLLPTVPYTITVFSCAWDQRQVQDDTPPPAALNSSLVE